MSDIRKRIGRKGEVSYQVRYKDQAGKPRYKSFDKRKDALAFEGSVGAAVKAGTHVHDRDTVTVSAALDVWLDACETTGRRGREPVEDATLRTYRIHARHIRERLGGTKLSQLTGPICDKFSGDLIREMSSRSNAQAVWRSFKGMLGECRVKGLIGHDPAFGITVSVSKRQRGTVEIPEASEVEAILRQADELAAGNLVVERSNGRKFRLEGDEALKAAWARYRPLFFLVASAGMRMSEVRGLPWPAVDLDRAQLEVRQRAEAKGVIGPPKSAAGYRTIPLPSETVKLLRAWKELCPKSPKDLVFPSGTGRPESHSNIEKRGWHRVLSAAGVVDHEKDETTGKVVAVPRYGLHAIRHFYASLMIAAGYDIKTIQARMGHEDPAFTVRQYGHLMHDIDPSQVAVLGARLLGDWDKQMARRRAFLG